MSDERETLAEEFARLTCALPFAAVRSLIDMGVPAATVGALTGAGMLALADVDLSRDGSRFALGGPVRRLLLGIPGSNGELIDVAALSSSDENVWALATGLACLLGEEQLEHAVAADRRELRLHPTPFAWLRAGMEGVAVLEWGPTAVSALRCLRPFQTIVCDPGAGPVLEKMLARGGMPLVAEDRRGPIRRAA
ncbi:hypothetical protein [Tsuneonella sp. HG222]